MGFVDERQDLTKDINMQRQERNYFYFLNKMSLLSKPLDIRTKRREIARLLTKNKNIEKKYEKKGSCC